MTNSDLEILKKSITNTMMIVSPSPLSCVLLSCAFKIMVIANKGPKVSVVAGDLFLNGRPVFKSNDDFSSLNTENIEKTEVRIFDGHAWIEVNSYIIDLSLLRTAFAKSSPIWLKEDIAKAFNRTEPAGIMLPSNSALMDYGLQYERKIVLTGRQINYFANSLGIHNQTVPMSSQNGRS